MKVWADIPDMAAVMAQLSAETRRWRNGCARVCLKLLWAARANGRQYGPGLQVKVPNRKMRNLLSEKRKDQKDVGSSKEQRVSCADGGQRQSSSCVCVAYKDDGQVRDNEQPTAIPGRTI